jgi:dTMP kinase
MTEAKEEQRPSQPMTKGLFITLEGNEGSGKSTQTRLLVERLRAAGYTVVDNQEPGGTSIGQQIRRILLDPASHDMSAYTELLLMFASRAQASAERIRPALDKGHIVVSDRFTDSSLAYQGGGRDLGFDTVLALHRLVLGDLFPDLTLCVDIDVATGLERARGRNRQASAHSSLDESRLDQQSIEFHERVRAAYHRLAALEPRRFKLIDAHASIEKVAERIWSEVAPLLPSVR